MDSHFGGVIWTNHALSRMRERGIKQGDAWATWKRPEQSRKGTSGGWVYYRAYGNERIEVVAKKNERGEWIVLSVWSRPVFSSRNSSRPSSPKKISFWRSVYNFIFKA
jgi:hypothetical protein